jgi:hypothetical protein
MKSFSERHGYRGAEPEITIREDAPDNLRYAVLRIAADSGLTPSQMRDIVCRILFVAPDRNNWSDYPNVWDEIQGHLEGCLWFRVYDVAEALYRRLQKNYDNRGEQYKTELNRFFVENGIGWQLTQDGIVYRGDEPFRAATAEAREVLELAGRAKAAAEIHEAILDISRRPSPDVTGAIQHSMAALECTARDVLNMPNSTLGDMVYKLNLPKPLDTAVDKLWGFASQRARHVREGDQLDSSEAELVVSVACALSTFLCKRGNTDGSF